MTEVNTIREAYAMLTQPLKLHKFVTPYNGATAFVLASTEQEALALLNLKCAEIEHPNIVYQGAKELHELKTACVLMNQILAF